MLSRDHNILWLPESNGYPTRTILGATLGRDNVPSTWPAIRLQSDRIHAAVRDSVGTLISFTGRELFFF